MIQLHSVRVNIRVLIHRNLNHKKSFYNLIRNMYISVDNMTEIKSDHVRIKDKNKVNHKLDLLVKGNLSNLQIVTDFDYTITKQASCHGEIPSSFHIFNECKSIPQSFLVESNKLYEKYRPIEIDPHMPLDEKTVHMTKWWNSKSELLKGFPFSAKEIHEIAGKYNYVLRERVPELLNLLNKNNVPVLVFSAGLGESVAAILQNSDVLYPNIKIISNFFKYKDGLLDGLKDPIIHNLNKNETVLQGSEYYNTVKKRTNVIVMGDSLGDASMADGMPHSEAVLKIGFLYDHVEKNLPAYMNAFDIVLIDDQTMNVPLSLLSLIK